MQDKQSYRHILSLYLPGLARQGMRPIDRRDASQGATERAARYIVQRTKDR